MLAAWSQAVFLSHDFFREPLFDAAVAVVSYDRIGKVKEQERYCSVCGESLMKKLSIDRYYLHPRAILEDGKFVCEFCGAELSEGNLETVLACSTSSLPRC